MNTKTEHHLSQVLDSKHALSQVSRDSPKDLLVPNQHITRIGNLCDVTFLRKLHLSFNPIKTLDGIDQLPQLRELQAYCCGLEDVGNLRACSKLEIVFLQQNCISSISDTFTLMTKLQELRLDKNRLSKIESLQACQALKKLNVASNQLVSLEGICGLQSLTELNLSNNGIRSLSALKGLPSLKELNASYNQIKSLDGLQNVLKLESCRLEHNQLLQLQIPTYSSYATKGSGGGTAASTSAKTAAASTTAATKKGTAVSTKDNTKTALPSLDKPILSELYLGGNRIKHIHSLETYAHCLEVLDLSSNELSSLQDLGQALIGCKQLIEIRIFNNPVTSSSLSSSEGVAAGNEKAVEAFREVLTLHCPRLEALDGIVFMTEDKSVNSGQVNTLATPSISSTEFHTWERGIDEPYLDDEDQPPRHQSSTAVAVEKKKDTMKKPIPAEEAYTGNVKGKKLRGISQQQIDKDSDEEDNEDDDEDDEDPEAHLALNVPKLSLKHMLTQEEIEEKESQFTSLLQRVKEVLHHQTVFEFADVKKALEESPADSKVVDSPVKAKVQETKTGEELKMKLEHASALIAEDKITPTTQVLKSQDAPHDGSKTTTTSSMPVLQHTTLQSTSARDLHASVLSEDKDVSPGPLQTANSQPSISLPSKKALNTTSTSIVKAKIQSIQQHQKKSNQVVLDAQSILANTTTNLVQTEIGEVDFTDIKITKNKYHTFLPTSFNVEQQQQQIATESAAKEKDVMTSSSAPISPSNRKSAGKEAKDSHDDIDLNSLIAKNFKPKSVGYDIRDLMSDNATNDINDSKEPAPEPKTQAPAKGMSRFAIPSANTATMMLSMTNDYSVVNTTLKSHSEHNSRENTPRVADHAGSKVVRALSMSVLSPSKNGSGFGMPASNSIPTLKFAIPKEAKDAINSSLSAREQETNHTSNKAPSKQTTSLKNMTLSEIEERILALSAATPRQQQYNNNKQVTGSPSNASYTSSYLDDDTNTLISGFSGLSGDSNSKK